MARNNTLSSFKPNASKKTFKSYIDFNVVSNSNFNGESNPNSDEVWTTLGDNELTHDLNRFRSNTSINVDTREKKVERHDWNRSTSSIGSLLNDTIDGVNYFYSHTRHRTGVCGQLSLNTYSLMFLSYTSLQSNQSFSRTNNSLSHFIPFNSNNNSDIEIDLLNIYDIKDSIDTNFILITIFCFDFRLIRFQIKNCEQTKRLIDKLRRLTTNGIINRQFSTLTKSLKDSYSYVFKADWDLFERHWKECYKVRLTQINENYQLSDSLPQSFVVPKTITDQMLIGLIATQTRGQRVPIVCYLYPKNGNLLLRSTAFDNYDDLNALLKNMVNPLRQINVESILPPLLVVEQSFDKLREVIFYNDSNEEANTLSKIGKWINCVNTSLKTVQQIVQIISNEASVGIVEELDRDWNCVVSSLVQLMIDPKRRTFYGFESLISKEWIYLTGLAYRKSSPYNPNHVLFTLFLDCVSQLIIQNPFSFEFSSFYLIWLFDSQYKQSLLPKFANSRKSSRMSLNLSPLTPPIREGMSFNHLMLITNPFYKKNKQIVLTLNTHISQMHYWSSLYLRWQSRPNLEHLSSHEMIYLNELQSRNQL